jgi:hypothetical protein
MGTTADTGKDDGREVTHMTFTPEQLRQRALHRRAVEAAVWEFCNIKTAWVGPTG